MAGKQFLEAELVSQKEPASEYKGNCERLREQFTRVNGTGNKFLKTMNNLPSGKFGKEERTIQSMKSTLSKL